MRVQALFALLIALSLTGAARAEVAVPVIEDLAAEARLARAKQVPLLIMFYAEHCGYCQVVEEEFLEPMIISGDYEDKVLIRRLLMTGVEPIRDFDGDETTAAEVSARYGVMVTPTLVFVDADGQQLADKLVGLTTRHYYGGYVDERIASARERLDLPVRAASGPNASGCAVC